MLFMKACICTCNNYQFVLVSRTLVELVLVRLKDHRLNLWLIIIIIIVVADLCILSCKHKPVFFYLQYASCTFPFKSN